MKPRILVPLLAAMVAIGQKEPRPPVGAAPKQPVAFSHRVHVATGLKCAECHANAATAKDAGMPAVDLCMRCHIAIKKDSSAIAILAQSKKDKLPVKWVPVYRLPDFVYFSHRKHTGTAGLACDACHGEVAARDVLTKEKSIGMASCQACHDARKANNGCDACHDPHPA